MRTRRVVRFFVRVRTARITSALAGAILCLHLAAGLAWGIVVSDDPNLHLVTPPSAYDRVAFLSTGDGSSAVLINPWYILTANHTGFVNGTASFYLSGGTQTYTMMEKFSCPNADLAVLRLNRSTGLTGYSFYDPNVYGSEIGQGGTLLGYGMSGTPATVQAGGDPNYPRGTLRIGYNKIDAIDPNYSNHGQCLQMDFDSPSTHGPNGSLGADKEAMVALGDSGGAVFINAGGSLRLAGIHVAVAPYDLNHWPKYGDFSYHVRTAAYTPWIGSKVQTIPGPQSGDFNNDTLVTYRDIDDLSSHYGSIDMWFDVTGDSLISRADSDYLIHTIIGTEYGDIDLDHMVDLTDYGILAYYFGSTGSASWSMGDFNGDKNVNFADYQILEASFGFGTGGGLACPPVPVPEPATIGLLACGAGWLMARRSSRREA